MTEMSSGFLLPSQTSHTRGGAGSGSSSVGDVAGVKLDQYKRYLFTAPSTPDADLEPWTRVTTVSAFGVNQGGLRVWTERKILGGLALAPVLRTRLAVMGPNGTAPLDTAELDSILEEAKTRGGVHDAADEGTARHHELERWVRMGADYPGPPYEVAADVTAAIHCILDAGLKIVRIENLICIESMRVAGRVDVYAQAPNGKLRALDWKTGKDAVGTPAKRAQFSMQLAPYGNASHVRRPDGTWQLADELNIDHETAYLVHVHDGVAQLYDVPLLEGWRAFQAAYILHRHSSAGGAPVFLPIGRPARFDPVIEDLEPMPVSSPADWSDWSIPNAGSMRCPNCGQLTCIVSHVGEWNCDACQVFGVDHDALMAAKEENGDAGSSAIIPAGVIACGPGGTVLQLPSEDATTVQAFAESLQEPERERCLGDPQHYVDSHQIGGAFYGVPLDHVMPPDPRGTYDEPITPLSDRPDEPAVADQFPGHRVQEPAEPAKRAGTSMLTGPEVVERIERMERQGNVTPDLAPLADRSKGERGCGVCGRKGHKRGSAKCLGDADPAKVAADEQIGREVGAMLDDAIGPKYTPPSPDPFPQPPAMPVAADYCDGRCNEGFGEPTGLEPERDADGNVTGRYVCKGCGKPATVAAVRAHVSSFSGDARPEDERAATHERLVRPATIPDPPAPAPAWLPSVAETRAADIEMASSRAHLDRIMLDIQERGQMTDDLKMLGFRKWNTLS